ncbi:MAG TPA: hypothetical protein VMI75_37375 [Polyangiaceae bacterium]|nr:hypothetical protein [Polyangiaceae bacterium]
MTARAGRAVGALSLLLLVAAGRAHALPIFARGDDPACARCHLGPPRLNAHGIRFLRTGFGASGSEHAEPLPAHGPQACIVAAAGYAWTQADVPGTGGGRERSHTGAFGLDQLDLHAAGRASANVSYHVEASLDSAQSAWSARTAYVVFDDLLPNGALAAKAGIYDAGMPFLSSDRRGTRAPDLTPVALAARGIELGGLRGDWTWAAGLINSQRTTPATPGGAPDFNALEDEYAWLVRAVHDQQFGARMLFDRQDSDLSFHAWLQHLQFQAAAMLGGGRFWAVPAYTLDRFDDRPGAGEHERHQYALLELVGLLDPGQRWVVTARLEHEHVTAVGTTPEADLHLEVLRLVHAFDPRTRVALEAMDSGDNVGGPRSAGFDAAVQLAY